MQNYESTFICKPDLPNERVTALIDKIKNIIVQNGGEILTTDILGRRRLAYSIKGYSEGIYTYFEFTAPGKTVSQIENMYRLTEDVIRYLTIKKYPNKKKVKDK